MTWEGLTPPYSTIVVDPPWEYGEGFAGGHARTPGKWSAPVVTVPLPYSSMTVADICSMPVGDLAAPDCRLFLWTTNRYLPEAFDVVNAWGFMYRQTLVWHKRDANLPASVAPNSAEFVLVATRGKPKRCETMPSAVLSTTRHGVHSAKPEAMADLIERVSPGPYVELFARAPRLGWDGWGYGYESEVAST